MNIRKFMALCLVLMLICGFAFAKGNQQGSKQITVGYAPTTMNNPFWLAVLEGVKSVLDPAGVRIVTIDPQNDQSLMNDKINDLLVLGIDVLLVAPFDSAGVRPALEECRRRGIPVVNFDTPVVDKNLVASIIASDNVNAGVVVAKDMMSKLPRGSKVAIIHSPSGGACIDRYDGFMKESGNYFNIVQPIPDGKGDTGVTLPLANDILQGNPDLKAFFAVNDPSAAGCVRALAENRVQNVLVYGVDGAPDAKQMIVEGAMTGTGAQSPIGIGKRTAEIALDVLAGKRVETNVVIPTFIINSANVRNYDIRGWQ